MDARDDASWIYIRNGHITVMVLMYIDEWEHVPTNGRIPASLVSIDRGKKGF